MIEEWRNINGYEGMYEVSDKGRVRSLPRKVKNNHSYKIVSGKILKQTNIKKGYKRVTFSVNQKSKSFLVHRLVAAAFIENPKNYLIINHIDENPTNNRVENLEWCTYKHNANHGTAIQRTTDKLTNGPCSKRVYQYKGDSLVKIWPSASECGRNGFHQAHVSACARGERREHKGFKWSYEEM